jgi:hypothetical protein
MGGFEVIEGDGTNPGSKSDTAIRWIIGFLRGGVRRPSTEGDKERRKILNLLYRMIYGREYDPK